MKELSEENKKFCYEYIKDFNGTQSLIRLGFAPLRAKKKAYRLLRNPRIREFLESIFEKNAEIAEINIDSIIAELKIIAFGNIDGDIIKTANKLKALEILGKYLGLFSERSKEPAGVYKTQVIFQDLTTKG